MAEFSAPVEHLLQFFTFEHLPTHLQEVSKPFAELALAVARQSSNPETTVSLRKLLESKDAAVRALIAEKNKHVAPPLGTAGGDLSGR